MENGQKTKKKFYKRWWFWVLVAIVFLIIIGSLEDKSQEKVIGVTGQQTPLQQETAENKLITETGASKTQEQIQPAVNTTGNQTKAQEQVAPIASSKPTPSITPTPTSKVETTNDRDKMLEIFKTDASTKWGGDYAMVNYEVKKQTEAYDWIIKNTSYADILVKAKQKWANDYAMIKYEYEKQVVAYEWINKQTAYPTIMAQAKQKWGDDYSMVKYEYEKQVEAYKSL